MSHQVFISFSSKDERVAKEICKAIEDNRLWCWMAPRNELAGIPYADQLMTAIEQCKVMILVFSLHSNNSHHVRGEVEKAINSGKIVVPFRIEDVRPTGGMEHYLGPIHWLDAINPPLNERIEELVEVITRVLSGDLNFGSKVQEFKSAGAEPEGLEGITSQIRRLPRTAQLFLAWRCTKRLPMLLSANWLDGIYMWDTIDYITDTLMPVCQYRLRKPESGDDKALLNSALTKVNQGLATAIRTSHRQRTPSVVIACLKTFIAMIELGLDPNYPPEEVVFNFYKMFGILNPENSIVRREIQEEVAWLLAVSQTRKWTDDSPISDELFERRWWQHGEPAMVNSSLYQKGPSFWESVADLFGK